MKNRSKYIKKEESGWLSRFDIFIPIVILLSMINPLRAAISQYYIPDYPDDIVWVHYAQQHFNNISGLLTDKMGTGLRPTINVIYYIGYALWGSNEAYYYLMNGALFAGAMLFLYLLIRMLHSRAAGMLAVLLYLFLDASFILVWKMNYTTSIAEIFFINASLYYSIHFFEKKERMSLILAIIFGIFAFFSKEPSMVIIPAVNIIYLLHKKEMGVKNRVIAIAVNLLPVLLLYVIMVYISPEVSVSASAPISERVKERLVFYVEQELSWQLKNPYIFFLGIIGTFYFRKFAKDAYGGIPVELIKNVVSVSIITTVYIASQMGALYSLSSGIIVMLLLAIGFMLGNTIQRIGIAWFGVSFAPLLLTSQVVQPTYLAEPNIGMSLFLGVTLWEFLKYIYSGPRPKNTISRIFNYANIAVIVLVVIVQLSAVPTQIGNTNNYHNMVSDSQNSFREAVDYLTATAPRNSTVYYISTGERQKVGGGQIDSDVFGWLLCFKGRCDIRIETLDSEQPKDGYIVLLSNVDAYIFTNEYKNLTTQVQILKSIKNGERVAYVLEMKR
ncbi:MAG: glycosyltransferase family 39 protein [Candidatus Methanoperedens sp.]|nr:glycosyltransferase family 39 protein [Candidatus Methanoperedens sp.]